MVIIIIDNDNDDDCHLQSVYLLLNVSLLSVSDCLGISAHSLCWGQNCPFCYINRYILLSSSLLSLSLVSWLLFYHPFTMHCNQFHFNHFHSFYFFFIFFRNNTAHTPDYHHYHQTHTHTLRDSEQLQTNTRILFGITLAFGEARIVNGDFGLDTHLVNYLSTP